MGVLRQHIMTHAVPGPSPADTAEIQRLAKHSKHIRETGMLFIRR